MKAKVTNMKSSNGKPVPNQFIVYVYLGDNNIIYFQSYNKIIAKKSSGKIYLDRENWDYSTTTGKYRNQFLNESKAETVKKLRDGVYELANLN